MGKFHVILRLLHTTSLTIHCYIGPALLWYFHLHLETCNICALQFHNTVIGLPIVSPVERHVSNQVVGCTPSVPLDSSLINAPPTPSLPQNRVGLQQVISWIKTECPIQPALIRVELLIIIFCRVYVYTQILVKTCVISIRDGFKHKGGGWKTVHGSLGQPSVFTPALLLRDRIF